MLQALQAFQILTISKSFLLETLPINETSDHEIDKQTYPPANLKKQFPTTYDPPGALAEPCQIPS